MKADTKWFITAGIICVCFYAQLIWCVVVTVILWTIGGLK